MFTKEILESVDRSVLCWLATSSSEGVPGVSPKEIFTTYGDDQLLIANIASPNSSRNIGQNPKVCVAFVDILVQKGYQLFGEVEIIKRTDPEFDALSAPLNKLTQGKFPFATLFRVTVTGVKPIIAPRYRLYPETTEAEQIASAIKTYRLDRD